LNTADLTGSYLSEQAGLSVGSAGHLVAIGASVKIENTSSASITTTG
jgi:hypothetical protein